MEKAQPNTLNTTINKNDVFINIIKNYCKENKPYIYILTPCYGSLCFVSYVLSLIKTIQLFRQFEIPLQIVFCRNDSLISRARNNLIAKAMNNPETTHIIFIDNDITWDPIDILKLIISNKNLVGGAYPLKKYNWNKLLEPNVIEKWIENKNNSKISTFVTDEEMIQHNLLRYNINYIDSYLKIEQNITKVRHIPTGFMMLKRETIELMIEAYPETKYTDDVGFLEDDENKYAYALFDCGVQDDHYFSEDWYFCHRWTKIGGDVYLDVSINLKHTGNEDFNGSFISSII